MGSASEKKLEVSSIALPEDEQPAGKKQKLEGDKLIRRSYSSDSDYDSDFDIPDSYYQACKASDGFDVPPFRRPCCGMIARLKLSENNLEFLIPFSEAAIKVYNSKHGTDYKVVRVEKTMHQIVGFVKYYITFEATDTAAGSTKTFEAIVLRRIPIDYERDPYEIWLCREQGDRTVRAEIPNDDEEDDED